MNLICLGDTHIGCYAKNLPVSYKPWEKVFDQVYAYAERHNVEHLVQLGDVFDSPFPSLDDRLFLLKQLLRNGLNWWLYYGNHDYNNVDHYSTKFFHELQSLVEIPRIKFIQQPSIEKIGKEKACFLPWPHTKPLDKEPMLVFGHFAAPGALADNGMVLKDSPYKPLFGPHTWVLGDLHTFQRTKQYVYPGAPLQFNYGQPANRYFLHVTGKFPYKLTRVPIELPYLLEQVSVQNLKEKSKLLKHLDKRTDITYTKVKLATALYSSDLPLVLDGYPRLIVEPSGKKVVANDADAATLLTADSNAIRRSLTVKQLKKKGLDNNELKQALSIVDEIEQNLRNG